MDINEREDKLINPLNSILLLTYGTECQIKVNKEIDKIVDVLEQENIIRKRRKIKSITERS
jgi:hypothetical protein